MNNHRLKETIIGLIDNTAGRVGVCAETLDGERSFAINADQVYPTASSVKMFILFTLLALSERGELSLADRLEFTEQSAQPGSGVLYHLQPGLRPTLKDLATLMMMISDNSALIMLTGYLGLDTINAEILGLGLEHSRCGDWSNFDTDYADSLSFGSAKPREFTDFLLRMQRVELLSRESTTLFWDILRIQKYIMPLRRHLPASPWSREFGFAEPVWVASKGGMFDDCTSESGLVRVYDGGWVISVMACDMPQISGRPEIGEDLISTISLEVYNAWAPLYQTGEST
jgi:beta-lactamase class A